MYVSMQFPVEMGTRRSDPDVVVWFQIGDGSLIRAELGITISVRVGTHTESLNQNGVT
jgi:hypothetical protein